MGTDKSLPVRMRLDMKAFRRHSTWSRLTSTSPRSRHGWLLHPQRSRTGSFSC
jgi:hypothetical protein